jgi:hypothetical protein
LYAADANSPQSHKLTEGSRVRVYTTKAMANITQPNTRFIVLKLFMRIYSKSLRSGENKKFTAINGRFSVKEGN